MVSRVFDFYSGPAALPASVLDQAAKEMLSFRGTGMSIMEMSHRSEEFLSVLRSAESRMRQLLGVPDNYHILFLQGGATMQFSMVPLNFLAGGTADYVVTGVWSEKARKMAAELGTAKVIFDSMPSGCVSVPVQDELQFSSEAAYIHYVSNETIGGVEFAYDLDGFGIPVVCDASSNILSKPIKIEKYSLIYAGAQKNIGPSGVTVVIVSSEFLAAARPPYSGSLSYNSFAVNESMPNTPNTWGIYIIDLVCEWLQDQGGISAIAAINEEKASMLYAAIDGSDGFYSGNVRQDARSRMNITYRLKTADLEDEFCTEASAAGLVGLRGHRSAGGIRASLYNAMPIEGVVELVEFMRDFAVRKG